MTQRQQRKEPMIMEKRTGEPSRKKDRKKKSKNEFLQIACTIVLTKRDYKGSLNPLTTTFVKQKNRGIVSKMVLEGIAQNLTGSVLSGERVQWRLCVYIFVIVIKFKLAGKYKLQGKVVFLQKYIIMTVRCQRLFVRLLRVINRF